MAFDRELQMSGVFLAMLESFIECLLTEVLAVVLLLEPSRHREERVID